MTEKWLDEVIKKEVALRKGKDLGPHKDIETAIEITEQLEKMTDKEKENPIVGIAEWLGKINRHEEAKVAATMVKKSPKSSEEDKKKANAVTKEANKKTREWLNEIIKKEVVLRKVKDLKPHKDIEAAIKITVDDYRRIKDDIENRGIQVPLVVWENANEVVCGITRLKACQELEIEEVPCFVGKFPTFQDILEYAVKDNVMRRQLDKDERMNLITLLLREKDTTTIQGRPPKTIEAFANKVKAAVQTKKAKLEKVVKELKKSIVRDYKWVVGKDHNKDKNFPSEIAAEVKEQLGLLKRDGIQIIVKIVYEVYENQEEINNEQA